MICAKYSIPINVRGGGLIALPLFAVHKTFYHYYIILYGAVYLVVNILLFLCVRIV